MYKIAVCDDNEMEILSNVKLIKEYFKSGDYEIFTFNDPLCLINSNEIFDIAFLDIEMTPTTGIEVGYELRKKNPLIYIFMVTGYSNFLDDALDLNVYRFLEKPVDKQRLFKALDNIVKSKIKITFCVGHQQLTLDETQIVCVYSSLRKTHITTDLGFCYDTTYSFKFWKDKLLQSKNFALPHNSYLVNLSYICSITSKYITLRCKNGKSFVVYGSQRLFPDFKKSFILKG